MYSDWNLSTWAPTALQWLHLANDASDGLLDIILMVSVVAPALLVVWSYLSRSAGGSDAGDEA